MDGPTRVWYQSFTDPHLDAPYFERLRDCVTGALRDEYEVEVHGMRPADRFLHPLTELRCSMQMIRNALAAERAGYGAFVIGHFQEPGLAAARAAVDIPVIGLGEATLLHACTLGRKIGLVTINSVFIPFHERQIAEHGLRERVVAITAVDTQVADYNRAFTDAAAYAEVRGRFLDQLIPLVEAGVEVIVPAGGYPMLLFAHERGMSVRGAVVLSGIPVALLAAETAIRLRRFRNTTTSRAGAYALPPAEAVEEFLAAAPPADQP
jgi:allantoin racemase